MIRCISVAAAKIMLYNCDLINSTWCNNWQSKHFAERKPSAIDL